MAARALDDNEAGGASAWRWAKRALEEIERTGARADRVVRRTLRRAALDDEGRALLAGLVYGTRCWQGRLDAALALRGITPTWAERAAAWAVVFGGRSEQEVREGSPAASAVVDAAAAADRELVARVEAGPPDAEALAALGSLPAWLARRWLDERAFEPALRLALASNEPGPLTLRANPLLVERGPLIRELRAEGHDVSPGMAPRSVVVAGRLNVRGDARWQRGAFEVQDAGSQLIVEAVQAAPGQIVVDLCAGRGGKALALAGAMADRGRVVAVDVDEGALADLRARLARAAAACVEVRAADATAPGVLADLAGRADRVLVDGPCSALGTLRRGPDHRWRLSEEEAAAFPFVQLALLEAGARLLRPGGRIVYATCTLLAAENDEVADAFSAGPGAGLRPVAPLDPLAISGIEPGALRVELTPDRQGTDGFFLAAWER